MDWQQKAAALDAAAEIRIMIRRPGDWYVSQNMDIKDEHVLRSICGSGETPEAAVEDHWRQCVEDIEKTALYLVARNSDNRRKAIRWNGFMWMDIPEPERHAA